MLYVLSYPYVSRYEPFVHDCEHSASCPVCSQYVGKRHFRSVWTGLLYSPLVLIEGTIRGGKVENLVPLEES